MDDIDLIMGSLETSIGSIGGFCAGTTYVVEHQTLAGLGYCFSASLPPMLAAGADRALQLMEENPEMFPKLAEICEEMHNCFENLPGLKLIGDRISPVKHLRLKRNGESREKDRKTLHEIVLRARNESRVALVIAAYLEDAEVNLPPVSIRLTCNALLTTEEIHDAAKKVTVICQDVFG